MNREIIFRGFHKEENGKETIYIDGQPIKGKWVYGWLFQIKYATKKYFIRVFPNKDDEYIDYVVIPETIGQCVGLSDKNGKLIFENDVCKGNSYSDENDLFIIKYGKYRTKDWKNKFVTIKTCQFGWYAEFIKDKSQVHLVSPNGIEVLRTIFDKEVNDNEFK